MTEKFGANRVALGAEAFIQPGDDYEEALITGVQSVEVILVLVGSQWAGEWLTDANDYDRIVMTTALSAKKRIIPLLVNGAMLPANLPEALAGLARRSGMALSQGNFESEFPAIIESLSKFLPLAETPAVVKAASPAASPSTAPKAQVESVQSYRIDLNQAVLLRTALNNAGYRQPVTKFSQSLNAGLSAAKYAPLNGEQETVIAHLGLGKALPTQAVANIVINVINRKDQNGRVVWGANKGETFITNRRLIVFSLEGGGMFRKPDVAVYVEDWAKLRRVEPIEQRGSTAVNCYFSDGELAMTVTFPMSGAAAAATMLNAFSQMSASSNQQQSKTWLDYTKSQQSSNQAQQNQQQINATYSNQANALHRAFLLTLFALAGMQ
ncbi:MAG: hypothetical protein OHK0023_17310 [Anaerolineae bacterium]